MIVTIHQPVFLPWLGFFCKMVRSNILVLLDTVQFSKNGYQNRVEIKTHQGKQWLTVPVLKGTQAIEKTIINSNTSWRKKHLKSIIQNYSRCEYFDDFFPILEIIYNSKEWERLSSFNICILNAICEYLEIKTHMIKASSIPDLQGGSTELLVNILKWISATTYISGNSGRNYLEEDKFKENNIELMYLLFANNKYNQLHGDFIPGLSIIDFIFNCGKEGFKKWEEEITCES